MARKTFKKKGSAERAKPSGASVYKVKKGWRISRKKKTSRRRRRSWP